LADAVSELLDAPLLSLSPSDLTAELRADFACAQRLSARILALVQHASVLGIPSDQAASSTQVWLAELLGMSIRQASSLTRLASRLPSVPVVAEALAAGTVNVEQAQVIASTIADLPSECGAEGKARAAALLTGYAACDRERPEILARHKDFIMETVAPEVAEERLRKQLERGERSAYARRGLTFTPNSAGGVRLSALLDTEAAAIMQAALDPISGPGSLRDWTHPHAGNELCDRDHCNGHPDTKTASASGLGPNGVHRVAGLGSTGAGNAGDAVADGDADDAVRDTRTAAARRIDALTFLCERMLADGQLPESGGEKPQVVVTMRWQDLRDQVGHGLLDTGDLLTPQTVRRLACDAKIIPAMLAGQGQVLDVGRARRLIDGPLRRALVLRDKGCAWPGCDRPPRWTDGHHIQHWADGGPTSLTNAVLLCGHHHREVHKNQWTIRIAADGQPEFQPPPHIDPLQRWRRNRIHRRT
jgi:hypothetical protein